MGFCNKHKIHLISDEIYAYSVYHTGASTPGFTSILSLDTTGIIDNDLVHVMYGMAKVVFRHAALHHWSLTNHSQDFAAAGLRLGCLITRNTELGQAVQSLSYVTIISGEGRLTIRRRFHGASPMADAIATCILEDEEWHLQFFNKSAHILQEHRKIVAEALDSAGIPYQRKA